jgi:hypothetical protein
VHEQASLVNEAERFVRMALWAPGSALLLLLRGRAATDARGCGASVVLLRPRGAWRRAATRRRGLWLERVARHVG